MRPPIATHALVLALALTPGCVASGGSSGETEGAAALTPIGGGRGGRVQRVTLSFTASASVTNLSCQKSTAHPLESGMVELLGSEADPLRLHISHGIALDDRGRLPELLPGDYPMRLSDGTPVVRQVGWNTLSAGYVTVDPGAAGTSDELRVTDGSACPGGDVHGRLVGDSIDGQSVAIAGMRFRIQPVRRRIDGVIDPSTTLQGLITTGAAISTPACETDANGEFFLPGLPFDQYRFDLEDGRSAYREITSNQTELGEIPL